MAVTMKIMKYEAMRGVSEFEREGNILEIFLKFLQHTKKEYYLIYQQDRYRCYYIKTDKRN